MARKQKSLLIMNESEKAQITLNLYVTWDVVCWLPYTSKSIRPNTKFLHSSDKDCKFEVVASFKDKRPRKVVLLKPQQWVGDRVIKISNTLNLKEDDIVNYPEEEKECRRKMNRDEELGSLDRGRNLYNILRLDMEEVRAMSKKKQNEEIRTALIRELRIWHPEFNEDGDEAVAREVIVAYDVLQDREKRAKYNNMADYDNGWLSVKRFKAVFCPEYETMEQKLAWIKRMGLLALSAGLTIGGIVGVVLTAGFSSPWLVTSIVGGLSSLKQTISKEAIANGCDVQKWLMKTGIGYLLAVMPGGAAVGVALLQSTALKLGEFLACRAAIGALSGAVASLVSDAKKKFVDGQDVTFKQAMVHAAAAATASSAATMAGIGVAKAMASTQTATASADLVGAVGEPVSQPSEANRLAKSIPSPLAAKGTKMVIEKAAEFTEKQLDDYVESGSPEEHFVVGQGLTQEWRDAITKAITEKLFDGNVRYISRGFWFSKMIVSFFVNGKEITKQVRGSGKRIHIPSGARKIKVRFKVSRPLWGDILKYDRFQKCWCVPYEPHVFQYETPPIRTFTIWGILRWEAVMKVTDERYNETNEM
ncbi:uncharacterized protein LOC144657407 [Oculina patagonica]